MKKDRKWAAGRLWDGPKPGPQRRVQRVVLEQERAEAQNGGRKEAAPSRAARCGGGVLYSNESK